MFVNRFAGQLDTEAFEGLDINLRQHHNLCVPDSLSGSGSVPLLLSSRVQSSTAGERDQDLIGVQSRVAASQISSFQIWIGSMAAGKEYVFHREMPASSFSAFKRRAAEDPSRSEVFPVMIYRRAIPWQQPVHRSVLRDSGQH